MLKIISFSIFSLMANGACNDQKDLNIPQDLIVKKDQSIIIRNNELISFNKKTNLDERRGCCSHHKGVCGCSDGRALCCDGVLSPSCGCD